MGGGDIIAIIACAVIIGAAVAYIIVAKLKGKRCIGCPDSSGCNGKCSDCKCSCHCLDGDKDK